MGISFLSHTFKYFLSELGKITSAIFYKNMQFSLIFLGFSWKCIIFLHPFFNKKQKGFVELQCSYFFRQFEPRVFLFLFLFIHVLIICNLYTWQLLHTLPVKNFTKYKSIASLNLVSLNLNLNLYLTEHNPNFTLFLIYS